METGEPEADERTTLFQALSDLLASLQSIRRLLLPYRPHHETTRIPAYERECERLINCRFAYLFLLLLDN